MRKDPLPGCVGSFQIHPREALNDLVRAGKVRALGASAVYGYQFYNMQLCARDHGWARFEAMENHYNLLYREDERELIPICRQMGVSLMLYSPLAAGPLTRAQRGRQIRSAAIQTVWRWASTTAPRNRICRSSPVFTSWQKDTA